MGAGKVSSRERENLMQLLLTEAIAIDNSCNGKGTCGKCKIKVISGDASSVCVTEKRLLKPEEIAAGIRLACLTETVGEVVVELPDGERQYTVLTEGFLPDFEKDQYQAGYGVAIDIGTTTVVTALIDLRTGRELSDASTINAQKKYGLDVLTRITYEIEHPENGIRELREAIVTSLNQMIAGMCRQSGADRDEIRQIVVGANCTMMHMLLGVDAKPIGQAPYIPVFTEARELYAEAAGLAENRETMLYCLPSVSGYIGADIVAGAYVCQLHRETGNVLFIDIGTNGEIVLATSGTLLCCSCAAGPALEGMNISAGMRAAEGAVEDVWITGSEVILKTIKDAPPAGLCGSGILAVVKELLRVGLVKKTGVFIKQETLEPDDGRYHMIRLNGTKREFVLCRDPELIVTQGDIRQVQLAKGAILSGVVALLDKAGIGIADLDRVMIAGQFGAHLPVDSLIGTGILPAAVKDKVVYVGNSSKTGAYMALMSASAKKGISDLAAAMEYIELADTENYERIFTQSMMFPDGSAFQEKVK